MSVHLTSDKWRLKHPPSETYTVDAVGDRRGVRCDGASCVSSHAMDRAVTVKGMAAPSANNERAYGHSHMSFGEEDIPTVTSPGLSRPDSPMRDSILATSDTNPITVGSVKGTGGDVSSYFINHVSLLPEKQVLPAMVLQNHSMTSQSEDGRLRSFKSHRHPSYANPTKSSSRRCSESGHAGPTGRTSASLSRESSTPSTHSHNVRRMSEASNTSCAQQAERTSQRGPYTVPASEGYPHPTAPTLSPEYPSSPLVTVEVNTTGVSADATSTVADMGATSPTNNTPAGRTRKGSRKSQRLSATKSRRSVSPNPSLSRKSQSFTTRKSRHSVPCAASTDTAAAAPAPAPLPDPRTALRTRLQGRVQAMRYDGVKPASARSTEGEPRCQSLTGTSPVNNQPAVGSQASHRVGYPPARMAPGGELNQSVSFSVSTMTTDRPTPHYSVSQRSELDEETSQGAAGGTLLSHRASHMLIGKPPQAFDPPPSYTTEEFRCSEELEQRPTAPLCLSGRRISLPPEGTDASNHGEPFAPYAPVVKSAPFMLVRTQLDPILPPQALLTDAQPSLWEPPTEPPTRGASPAVGGSSLQPAANPLGVSSSADDHRRDFQRTVPAAAYPSVHKRSATETANDLFDDRPFSELKRLAQEEALCSQSPERVSAAPPPLSIPVLPLRELTEKREQRRSRIASGSPVSPPCSGSNRWDMTGVPTVSVSPMSNMAPGSTTRVRGCDVGGGVGVEAVPAGHYPSLCGSLEGQNVGEAGKSGTRSSAALSVLSAGVKGRQGGTTPNALKGASGSPNSLAIQRRKVRGYDISNRARQAHRMPPGQGREATVTRAPSRPPKKAAPNCCVVM